MKNARKELKTQTISKSYWKTNFHFQWFKFFTLNSPFHASINLLFEIGTLDKWNQKECFIRIEKTRILK